MKNIQRGSDSSRHGNLGCPSIKLFLTTHGESVRAMLSTGIHPINHVILQWLPSVVTPSAGYNHIDMAECWRRGIVVTNAGNVFSDDDADYVVGLLLDVLRWISASNRYVRRGLWASKGTILLVLGSSLFTSICLFVFFLI
ncbi:hypothetical protein HHK36_027853 [Tetracentron sinense]|uniref:D-isomer specific 2-hydroxyacid dehydrogenase catalytic domain-containing protein n=1 Tax=Tetracentron sinense TaxID=13715 RepID=A0A835D4T1_TETSI|nr:hypothetical protein HHK36_027853 [Tetracentron sinense]